MIPFYMTDCDMHERLWMRNFTIEDATAGLVYDVGSSLHDLYPLYSRDYNSSLDGVRHRNSPAYRTLISTLEELDRDKNSGDKGRNTWQSRQRGGQGEPFYRDAEGFERGIAMTMDLGRKVFEEKWGRGRCDVRDAGMVEGDMWKVVGDWEDDEVQRKHRKEMRKKAKQRSQAGAP